MLKLKLCDGNCIEHKGDVITVIVYDLERNTNWGKFNYCENAIKSDQINGFIVKRRIEMKKIGWVIRSEKGYLTRKKDDDFGSLFDADIFDLEKEAESNINNTKKKLGDTQEILIKIEKTIKIL